MLRKYKQFMIGFLIGALLFSLSPVFAEVKYNIMENLFPVYINGKMEKVEGYNINGYTFLKLADFSKAGLEVKFNNERKRIEINGNVNVINKIEKDGFEIFIITGKEYVKPDDVFKTLKGKYSYEMRDGGKLAIINDETNLVADEISSRENIIINGIAYVEYRSFTSFMERIERTNESDKRRDTRTLTIRLDNNIYEKLQAYSDKKNEDIQRILFDYINSLIK